MEEWKKKNSEPDIRTERKDGDNWTSYMETL